jgi:hypothetical protein
MILTLKFGIRNIDVNAAKNVPNHLDYLAVDPDVTERRLEIALLRGWRYLSWN